MVVKYLVEISIHCMTGRTVLKHNYAITETTVYREIFVVKIFSRMPLKRKKFITRNNFVVVVVLQV